MLTTADSLVINEMVVINNLESKIKNLDPYVTDMVMQSYLLRNDDKRYILNAYG
jgi:hypothetical protein